MGFIPIFVALLGASFLYTVYTVSHINGHLKQIRLNKTRFKNNLNALRDQAAHSDIKELQAKLVARPSDDFQDFETENQWINELMDKSSTGDFLPEVTAQLKEQKEVVYQLRGLIRNYNSYIAESPATWVAKLWGFRKI